MLPGFGSSPLGSPESAKSLADQLKTRLEERRRSKEGEPNLVPDSIAADIQQAVKVANDNGELTQ